ncbi:uncharacterized protein ELE39_003477 [Cryptosporidium sp. chipmunk genotype I]|uniref:uncharacterized protein n=1 Tax=Cryptosporidium sp. chipmunk genotype I TaxID=1280935 RepID=UPI00351A84F3|nr:hypothetical protein ELE39_003477 [Cryptosporidium sp. chipmunk genotype I]
MGVNVSTCTLNPARYSYTCTANNVKIQNAGASLYESYLLVADNNALSSEVTYTFDCKINEEKLFGKVYCNAVTNQVTVSCGDDFHVLKAESHRNSSTMNWACSFIFDFYSTGFTLYSYQYKTNLFSTNKFYALPSEVKSSSSSKIDWKLMRRQDFESANSSSNNSSNKNNDHLEIKERLSV